MAVRAAGSLTVFDQTDVLRVATFYQRLPSTANPPSAPTTTETSAAVPGWSETMPEYGSSYRCYKVERSERGDGTCAWGAVTEDQSWSGASSASGAAATAQASADDARKYATNYLGFSSGTGLVVGDMTAQALGHNVLIDSDSVNIRTGTYVDASFGATTVELARRAPAGVIKMCGDKVRVSGQSRGVAECAVSTESWEDTATGDVDAGFDHPYAALAVSTTWSDGDRTSHAKLTSVTDDSGARSEVVAEAGTGASLEVRLSGSQLSLPPDGSAGVYDNGDGTTTFAVDADAYDFANQAAALTALGAAAASHTHGAGDVTSGTLPVARGGTGASEMVAAMANLRGVRWSSASSPDLDDLVDPACVWYVYGTLANCPVASGTNGWVACFSAGTNEIYLQAYVQYGSSVAASRRSVWIRIRSTSAWGDWYEVPTTAKDASSPSMTAASGFTVSSCLGASRLGAVATLRVQVSSTNALTSGTQYTLGTLAAGWRPAVTCYGQASDYRDVCWVTDAGAVVYRPGRAVSAGGTLTMSVTFALA